MIGEFGESVGMIRLYSDSIRSVNACILLHKPGIDHIELIRASEIVDGPTASFGSYGS